MATGMFTNNIAACCKTLFCCSLKMNEQIINAAKTEALIKAAVSIYKIPIKKALLSLHLQINSVEV